jgi:hypothetical protein
MSAKNSGQTMPERPKDVLLKRRDGTKTVCELAHSHTTKDGINIWKVATEMAAGDELHVGWMPSRTAIQVPVDPEYTGTPRLYRCAEGD